MVAKYVVGKKGCVCLHLKYAVLKTSFCTKYNMLIWVDSFADLKNNIQLYFFVCVEFAFAVHLRGSCSCCYFGFFSLIVAVPLGVYVVKLLVVCPDELVA